MWIRKIIQPLVAADPGCARFTAGGAVMRLVCGESCLERYAAELQSVTSTKTAVAAC